MPKNLKQIYSATYSNVPVFEFVTDEGPIMRRKSDSWINATHILKIAKFPKARRTRILEKDVQTGIHEKVQGGYGKYQGTYVPLSLGAEIARQFGVYDVLKPIFDFEYVEGRSSTPPPAPRHNHASASNVARRLQQQKQKETEKSPDTDIRKRPRLEVKAERPLRSIGGRRAKLDRRNKPELSYSQTMPVNSSGPNMGTFHAHNNDGSLTRSMASLPSLLRQDTEKDSLQVLSGSIHVKRDDLEGVSSDEEDSRSLRGAGLEHSAMTDDDDFMSGRELFGSRDSYNALKVPNDRSGSSNYRSTSFNIPKMLSLNGSFAADSLSQENAHSNTSVRGDSESVEYISYILSYLLDDKQRDGNGESKSVLSPLDLPENILHPPKPVSQIDINQPVDNDGNTVFHWACSLSNVAMIEFLVSIFSNNVLSMVKNYEGQTPLMLAVQFNNGYQLENFPKVLELLFDSVLAVDDQGRTVLHHIAIACGPCRDSLLKTDLSNESAKRREKFASYYLSILLAKLIDDESVQFEQASRSEKVDDRKTLVTEFINYPDKEGNTAFHIVAHNLSKKCIKSLIRYHSFLDFSIRNQLNYTVEDYLAAHNYVLRLEGTDDNSASNGKASHAVTTRKPRDIDFHIRDSREVANSHYSLTQILAEKIHELGFNVSRELDAKDLILASLHKVFATISTMRDNSQQNVLRAVNIDESFIDAAASANSGTEEAGATDGEDSFRGFIQDEISRLLNDITFQYLSAKEDTESRRLQFRFITERAMASDINEAISEQLKVLSVAKEAEPIDLAISLQSEINRRKELTSKLCTEEEMSRPLLSAVDENKENKNDIKESPNLSKSSKSSFLNFQTRLMVDVPREDKLYKYCKLISLSCGMSFNEVENSIDLIEQSLTKTAR